MSTDNQNSTEDSTVQNVDSTGDSKIGNVSIRSWNASIIILCATLTICYLAIMKQDPQWVLVLATNAISFLFGKAAGAAESSLR